MRALAAALLLAASALHADEPPPAPPFEIHAYVSSSYTRNPETPPSGHNRYRGFEFENDSFELDGAELTVLRPMAAAREIGFRVDAVAGTTIPYVTAASGLFRDVETGEPGDFDLQQALLGYVVPAGHGLRVEIGKFASPYGSEVIDGYEGWNDVISRSFIFVLGPYTHTGLRAAYPFSGKATLTGYLVNGWDNARDNNRGKSVGAQLSLAPTGRLSLALGFMAGPERNGSGDRRDYLDLVASFRPTDRLSLGVNAIAAWEKGAAGDGASASWNAIAGYARVRAHDQVALALRVERYDDADGARTGLAQTLTGLTGTVEWTVQKGLVVRGEVRHDGSDASPFEDGDGNPTDGQTTLTANALFAF